jgi:hypothetical protein
MAFSESDIAEPLFGWLAEASNNPPTREAEDQQRDRGSEASDDKLLDSLRSALRPNRAVGDRLAFWGFQTSNLIEQHISGEN